MDKAKIMRMCNEIEEIITAIGNWSDNWQTVDDCRTVCDKLKEIAAEITAPPKSNADRIRQMTDEELAEFFCQISQCCGNDASCSMCPIFDGCAQNVMCVEMWLKQEADNGRDEN